MGCFHIGKFVSAGDGCRLCYFLSCSGYLRRLEKKERLCPASNIFVMFIHKKKPVLKRDRFQCTFINTNYSMSLYRVGAVFLAIDWVEGHVIFPENLHLMVS